MVNNFQRQMSGGGRTGSGQKMGTSAGWLGVINHIFVNWGNPYPPRKKTCCQGYFFLVLCVCYKLLSMNGCDGYGVRFYLCGHVKFLL